MRSTIASVLPLPCACSRNTARSRSSADTDVAATHGRAVTDECLNQTIARDKTRLGIHLVHRPRRAARRDTDQPVGGHPPGLLRRRGEPFLAQPIDRRLDVTAGVAERPL